MKELPLKHLTQTLVNKVAAEAAESSRLRKNYNFHELSDKVQRFINVMQPGTYVRPHRHFCPNDGNGFEFFLVIQGSIGFLLMNKEGKIIHTECIRAHGPNYGIEIAQGNFHTLVALEPNSVTFEMKEGPYSPILKQDFLEGFPLEGTPESKQLVETWEQHFLN